MVIRDCVIVWNTVPDIDMVTCVVDLDWDHNAKMNEHVVCIFCMMLVYMLPVWFM